MEMSDGAVTGASGSNPLGAVALFAEIRHRGSGFGPVAVTSRWGTQSST